MDTSDKRAREIISDIHTKKSDYWEKLEQKKALELFHSVAERVPAYKNFLKKHKVNVAKVKSYKDLKFVPSITKNNYLRKYSLKELSWDGTLASPLVFTSTSGSTGEPVYFSRNHNLDWQLSVLNEMFISNKGFNTNEPTLVIVCFGMGVWIGGLIIYQSFELLERRGYPLSIITPGINKDEIFKILKKLAPNYKQIIIAGYPPFIKDIIDEAPHKNINLKDYNVRFLFAAEPFTEKFREYIVKETKLSNSLLDTMNIYGSADIGAMSVETPLSILVRKIASENVKLFNDIFGLINKTPTLTQYIPNFISFDQTNGQILLSGNNSIPLVKYSIGDHGGRLTFTEIEGKFKENGINLKKKAREAGIDKYYFQLPFVYIYERVDFSTTLYGLQVYPETIREVLLEPSFYKYLTGKFTLLTKFDNKQNQYLEINLELQKGKKVDSKLSKKLLDAIVKNLRKKNSEFKELYDSIGKKAVPKLLFWESEDPLYFRPGVKQKWVEK